MEFKPKNQSKQTAKQSSPQSAPLNRQAPAQPVQTLQNIVGNQALSQFLASEGIQAKLKVGRPNDRYEQEADRIAEQVMRMPINGNLEISATNGDVQRKCSSCTNGTCPKCADEEEKVRPKLTASASVIQRRMPAPELKKGSDEEEKLLQRKEISTGAPSVPQSVATSIDSMRGAGHGLPPATRTFFEPRFGVDFGKVRVHSGQKAADTAQALNARAFTIGHDVVFGASEYQPGSHAGRLLLAHELTHVIQQNRSLGGPGSSLIQRAPNKDLIKQPPPAALSVKFNGFFFYSEGTFQEGRKAPQLIAVALKRLLGKQYKPSLVSEIEREGKSAGIPTSGGFKSGATAKGGEPIEAFSITLGTADGLVRYLRKKHKAKILITEKQEEILELGKALYFAWSDLHRIARERRKPIPRWYNRSMFTAEMSRQGTLLRAYQKTLAALQKKGEAALEPHKAAVGEIFDALYQPIWVLEKIRRDTGLQTHKKTSGVFAALWNNEKPGRAPRSLKDFRLATAFILYIRTQKKLSREAIKSRKKRIELIARFARSYMSSALTGDVKQGDQVIRDAPATANAPPLPTSLSVRPAVQPPLFDAATDTEYAFEMKLHSTDALDHMMSKGYKWERIRVPDDKIGKPVDAEKLEGEEIGFGEVASVRFGRATRYAVADVKTAIEAIQEDIGTPGAAALTLVAANAILRYIGTGITLALRFLTKKRDEEDVVFPKPGL